MSEQQDTKDIFALVTEMDRNSTFGGNVNDKKYLTLHRGKHRHSTAPPGLYKIDWDGLKKDLDSLS